MFPAEESGQINISDSLLMVNGRDIGGMSLEKVSEVILNSVSKKANRTKDAVDLQLASSVDSTVRFACPNCKTNNILDSAREHLLRTKLPIRSSKVRKPILPLTDKQVELKCIACLKECYAVDIIQR